MEQYLPLGSEVPVISVTSPDPSDPTPTSSPATLEALDDSRLTPVPPILKTSLDQRQPSTNSLEPRSVPPSFFNQSFPQFNPQLRFSTKDTNSLDAQSNFSRLGARQTTCHMHPSSPKFPSDKEGRQKEKGRKLTPDEEERSTKNKPQKEHLPSFSSPWAPSSCSPKRVLWKEVEDYNRQRKRVRFLGWSGVENPWAMEEEGEGSSTMYEEGSEYSDSDSLGCVRPANVRGEHEEMDRGEGKEGCDRKVERGMTEGIKVVITTSKDGTTTTVLETGPNADLGNGVEIVTKTIVLGDEVTTVTTTTLIPLTLKAASRD